MTVLIKQLFAKQKLPQYTRLLFPVFLTILILWQVMVTVSRNPIGVGVALGAERGADFYQKAHLSGPLFNNFDIGSYLIYRLYPKEKVFIDGRPEAYPSEFIQQTYIPLQQNPAVFTTAENRYHFNTIFFAHTDQTPWAITFLKTIVRDPKWKIVYLDDTVIILAKNTFENAAVIQKYGMDLTSLQIANYQEQNFDSLIRLASFFNKTGLTDQELAMYQKILEQDPKYCLALYNSAVLLQNKQDSGSSVYAARYQASCQ